MECPAAGSRRRFKITTMTTPLFCLALSTPIATAVAPLPDNTRITETDQTMVGQYRVLEMYKVESSNRLRPILVNQIPAQKKLS